MIEVLIFAAKALLILTCILAVIITIAVLASKASQKPELEVEPLHKKYQDLDLFLKANMSSKEELKAEKKKIKKQEKDEKKSQAIHERVFVVDFDGDVQASQVSNLREEITSILQVATPQDEVIIKLESPGGVVHGYGLATSQLLRLKEANVPYTVCVDKVAASGGYMMASTANKIIAAPFSIVGSIGVVAQVPNFNRVLKKYDVDYKEYTAGDYKRTVSLVGEISKEGETHFVGRLNDTHQLFKTHVQKYRPAADLSQVANGDHWYGEEALKLGLVDKIQTSDDYILEKFKQNKSIYHIKHSTKQSLSEKISDLLGMTGLKLFHRITTSLEKNRFI